MYVARESKRPGMTSPSASRLGTEDGEEEEEEEEGQDGERLEDDELFAVWICIERERERERERG